jgi:transcriptional regulator with XRE-family HTH domain
MAIGSRVRERRKAHRLSQEQLASQAGLTWSAIQRLEAGQVTDPHYSTLSSIAHVLGTTVAELVGEEPTVPLVPAPPSEAAGQPSLLNDFSHRVEQWLEDLNARFVLMGDARFEDEVVYSDIDRLIDLLVEERARVEHELENPDLAKELFPPDVASKVTKKERLAEAMRPFRDLSKLRRKIGREYFIKERTAENYRHHLDLISAESSVSEEVRRSTFREEREIAFAL